MMRTKKLSKEIKRLQKLPYKWWKQLNFEVPNKEVKFNVPKRFNIKLRHTRAQNDDLFNKLIMLDRQIHLKSGLPKRPNIYSYLYAINVEILELTESIKKQKSLQPELFSRDVTYEIADVIIFMTLLLKFLNINLKWKQVNYLKDLVTSKPKRKTFKLRLLTEKDINNPSYLIFLFTTLVRNISKRDIIDKMSYNYCRGDHL